MEVELLFFYSSLGLNSVSCLEKYAVIWDILEDHRSLSSCERLRSELIEASESYPISWEMGYNSCHLAMNNYKQIEVKSYWWNEFVVIRLKEFLKLINTWDIFIKKERELV